MCNEHGQALVEFAVVVPVMVLMILGAIWFYELTHVKLKVQEAARFLAWETTAFPLHDYDEGPGSTLPLPAGGLPQVDLGSLGVNVPGGMGGMVNQQINNQLQTQLGQLIPFGGFGHSARAVAAVSAETMARFADMNSATLVPQSMGMLSASWSVPIAFATDREEEKVYGGPLANLLAGLGGAAFDIISSMTLKDSNPVAETLLASGKDRGGARAARIFGDPSWGFNGRGYIASSVGVVVKNEWFGSGVGQLILPNAQVSLTEDYGLLADSWRLNTTGVSYGTVDRRGVAKKSPLWKQVERMYLVNGRTRRIFRSVVLTPFMGFMRAAVTGTFAATSGPKESDLSEVSVVSRNYTSAQAGKAQIPEDIPPFGLYDTAPMRGDYGEAFKDRGEWFMGCKKVMSLGCTDGLAQDNPFGDYIVRE